MVVVNSQSKCVALSNREFILTLWRRVFFASVTCPWSTTIASNEEILTLYRRLIKTYTLSFLYDTLMVCSLWHTDGVFFMTHWWCVLYDTLMVCSFDSNYEFINVMSDFMEQQLKVLIMILKLVMFSSWSRFNYSTI